MLTSGLVESSPRVNFGPAMSGDYAWISVTFVQRRHEIAVFFAFGTPHRCFILECAIAGEATTALLAL